MKKLLLPLAILLFTACTKPDMPAPANSKADADTYRPTSTMRRSGDTLTKITRHPSESKPLPNAKKEPLITQ